MLVQLRVVLAATNDRRSWVGLSSATTLVVCRLGSDRAYVHEATPRESRFQHRDPGLPGHGSLSVPLYCPLLRRKEGGLNWVVVQSCGQFDCWGVTAPQRCSQSRLCLGIRFFSSLTAAGKQEKPICVCDTLGCGSGTHDLVR